MAKVERRKYYRISPGHGWASGAWDDGAGPYRVLDLSMGGALLSGKAPIPVGAELELSLRIHTYRPIALPARLIRKSGEGTGQPTVAVEFDVRTADDEDSLADIIARELVRQSNPVVLVGWSGGIGKVLVRKLTRMGFAALETHSPLDLVRKLEDTDIHVQTVLLGPRLGHASGDEVASFLMEWYPEIRRIYVTHPDKRVDLGKHSWAHGVITDPWKGFELKAAIQP